MDFSTIMDNPTVAAIVLAVLGTVGMGLRKIWTALVAAVVRRLEQVASDHDGDDLALVEKVRANSALMKTIPARVIIDQAKLHRSIRPPGGGLPRSPDAPPMYPPGGDDPNGPENGS